jgi:hypothetical protein
MQAEPASNWRPGQPKRYRKSVVHTIGAARSMLRSAVRRDEFDLEELAELRAVRLELDRLELEAVAKCRRDGATWQSIADAVGMHQPHAVRKWAAAVDALELDNGRSIGA